MFLQSLALLITDTTDGWKVPEQRLRIETTEFRRQWPRETLKKPALWESALKLCYDTKIHKRYPGLKRVTKKHMSNINLGQNTGICFERYWKALFAPECAPKEAFSCK